MAPSWPQRRPRWPPNGPKRDSKSLPNRCPQAFQHRSRINECPGQFCRRIWTGFGVVLGPMLGLCWVPRGLTRLLKTMKERNIKLSKTPIKHRSDGPSEVPRERHVGGILGLSWLLKCIFRHLNIMYPPKLNFRGGDTDWPGLLPAPGGPRGRGYRGGD